MKIFSLLLLPVVSTTSYSQSLNWQQRQNSWTATDQIVRSYISLMELKNNGNANDTSVNNFTKLFTPEAKIYDEIILSGFEGDMESPYSSRFRELPEYVGKMKQYYPSGIRAQAVNISYDFSQLNKNKVLVIMQKFLSGVSVSEYVVEVRDTIQLEIQLSENYSAALINRITKIGSEARLTNDMDGDFIIDQEDKCPKVAGTKEFKGCLPPDKQSYFTLLVSKDISANTKLDHAGLQGMQYESLLSNSSSMSDVSVEDNSTNYFGVSLEYSRFTGKSGKLGYGIGISYAHYDARIEIDQFKVRYRSTDAYGTSYKRVIYTNSRYVETIKTDYLKIPVLAHFKSKLSEKMGVFASAGIGLTFAISNKSSSDNTFNYEAIYAFVNNTLGFSAADNVNDFLITAAEVKQQNGSNESATMNYFVEHAKAGFDVALNKNVDDIENYKLKPGISFEIRGALSYDISSSSALLLGIGYTSFSNKVNQPDLYMLTDRSGQASSLVSGSESLKWNAISINLGLTHKLK